ncbi:MAG: flagellar export chaperone FliS [Spirochaetia bacterium]|nr:flagellar export chaperone FliS [Spirochaetia bacterium]
MSLSRRTNLSSTSGYDAYKSNEITTVSQGKLIVMLYEGAIRFLSIAKENIESPKKYDLVNTNILKTQEIISELMSSLNMDNGGKIAEDLLSLYVYFKKRLLEANMKKDKEILDEVIKHFIDLKNAWEEIEKSSSNTTPIVTAPKLGGGLSISG